MDDCRVAGTLYTSDCAYGNELDILLTSIERNRKHVKEDCYSVDLLKGSLYLSCLECPYYPYKDSSDPCEDRYTLHGKILLDNTLVVFNPPAKDLPKVEALHRVLMALGGTSSRSVKIKTKSFTEVNFSINKVIPQ
jgi:hypothetical protein